MESAIYNAMMALPASFYWGIVPKGGENEFPHVVADPPSGYPPEYDSAGVGTEPRTCRFHVWATNVAEARDLMRRIEAAFVDQSLSLDSGYWLSAQKGASDLAIDPDRGPNQERIWHGVLDLEFQIVRSSSE